MKFHKDGTRPIFGEVFVFGSNLAGIHGAGAAKAARLYYGAKLGVGIGPQDISQAHIDIKSYAIPTKDAKIETLPLDIIKYYVDGFVAYTKVHKDTQFFITRIGCGLAGYEDKDIAPMFKECGDNCSFAELWEKYLK